MCRKTGAFFLPFGRSRHFNDLRTDSIVGLMRADKVMQTDCTHPSNPRATTPRSRHAAGWQVKIST